MVGAYARSRVNQLVLWDVQGVAVVTNICSKLGDCAIVFLNKLFCDEHMLPLMSASASGYSAV